MGNKQYDSKRVKIDNDKFKSGNLKYLIKNEILPTIVGDSTSLDASNYQANKVILIDPTTEQMYYSDGTNWVSTGESNATTYKDNDIDSNGDGTVDDSDLIEGLKLFDERFNVSWSCDIDTGFTVPTGLTIATKDYYINIPDSKKLILNTARLTLENINIKLEVKVDDEGYVTWTSTNGGNAIETPSFDFISNNSGSEIKKEIEISVVNTDGSNSQDLQPTASFDLDFSIEDI